MLILAHHGVESLLPAVVGAVVLVLHQGRARLALWRAARAARRATGTAG